MNNVIKPGHLLLALALLVAPLWATGQGKPNPVAQRAHPANKSINQSGESAYVKALEKRLTCVEKENKLLKHLKSPVKLRALPVSFRFLKSPVVLVDPPNGLPIKTFWLDAFR